MSSFLVADQTINRIVGYLYVNRRNDSFEWLNRQFEEIGLSFDRPNFWN